jgi:hypothetical protein
VHVTHADGGEERLFAHAVIEASGTGHEVTRLRKVLRCTTAGMTLRCRDDGVDGVPVGR